jgi:hypothetical protein
VSGIFEGGSNDGIVYNKSGTNVLRYFQGANIYINRRRFCIIRDLSQPKTYQVRILIAGLMLNLPVNASECDYIPQLYNAMQGLILLTLNKYSNTESNPFGFTIRPGSLFNKLYETVTPDGMPLTVEQIEALLSSYFRIDPRPNPELYPTVWLYVTRLILLKLDFVLVTPNQWYLVGDLQIQTGWNGYKQTSYGTGFTIEGPGDVLNISYAECWQLQPQSIHGWDQSFPASSVRQNLIVGQINK